MDAAQMELLDAVDAICRAFQGSVTSWWRSPARNKSKGGVANSQHMKGLAADVTYPKWPTEEAVRSYLSPTMQLVRERDKNHDHIEQDPTLLARSYATQSPPELPSSPSTFSSPSDPTALVAGVTREPLPVSIASRSSSPTSDSSTARPAGARSATRSPLDKLGPKKPRGRRPIRPWDPDPYLRRW